MYKLIFFDPTPALLRAGAGKKIIEFPAPAYLAGKWLLANRFKNKPGGVYSGERLLEDPDEFISELKSMGLDIFESDVEIG